jgi:flagellar protein FlaG
MKIITNSVAEAQKTAHVSMEQKLDIKAREVKSVKKIDPQEEAQKLGKNYSESELQKAVEEANKIIFRDDKRFEFKLHERTNRMIVKLVDNETDEVVKEIPTEKILDLVASIWDLVGILVDERG